MSICLVTAYDKNWAELGALTSKLKRDYALRHGYHFIEYVGDPGDYHPSWMKLDAILMGLEVADTVFWSDADAIIVNPDITLGNLYDTKATLTISEDAEGLNCGVFFVSNDMMRVSGDRLIHKLNCWRIENGPELANESPWEQKLINEWHSDGSFKREMIPVSVVDQRLFNAYDPQLYPYGRYQDGDFMLHYPGQDLNWKWNQINKRLSALGCVEKRCNRYCKLERMRH